MGNKIITFCDLCKQQTDTDNFIEISFKKSGQRKSKPYDVCKDCAEKIQTQLVGDNELSDEWEFGSITNTRVIGQNPPSEQTRATDPPSEDDAFVASKMKEVSRRPKPDTKEAKSKDGRCLHYNRTSPIMSTMNGERSFVQKCRSCGATLALQTADERRAISKGEG